MENELDLHTDQKNHSDESAQSALETKKPSRKSRDSSLFSEQDLRDQHEVDSTEEHEDDQHTDYSKLNKLQLIAAAKELNKEASFSRIDALLKELKPLIEEIQSQERASARERFQADGGALDDFEYLGDHLDHEFDALVKLHRDRKQKYFQQLEQQKTENLDRKNMVLEKLRALADKEDSESSFQLFKELQKEWKSIGPVPNAYARTLWANYSALVDLYYDQRSIYFELKELDRRKNLEYKEELCERAEKLLTLNSIKESVKELNELHHEFKHTGPVPREEKDNIWNRFKAASDAIYARRDAYMAGLQQTFKKNLEEKRKLIDEVNQFTSINTDRIKEWNQKTKELLEIQKRWEAIGATSRSHAKEINKAFWSAFKTFFNNKSMFFKKLDSEREQNLEAKRRLIAKAIELKNNTDWDKTSELMKQLQQEWKSIGPVPDKQREKIFAEFKEACDFFFENRREQFGVQDEEHSKNLELKKGICDVLEEKTKNKSGSTEELYSLIDQFNTIGFVPKKSIKSIKARFDKAVESYVKALPDVKEEEKGRVEMEIQLMQLKSDPFGDRKIQHKEQAIKKQISKAENDIAVLQNNIEFFGRSKNAEKFKTEFTQKLEMATGELKALKKQLKMLKTVS